MSAEDRRIGVVSQRAKSSLESSASQRSTGSSRRSCRMKIKSGGSELHSRQPVSYFDAVRRFAPRFHSASADAPPAPIFLDPPPNGTVCCVALCGTQEVDVSGGSGPRRRVSAKLLVGVSSGSLCEYEPASNSGGPLRWHLKRVREEDAFQDCYLVTTFEPVTTATATSLLPQSLCSSRELAIHRDAKAHRRFSKYFAAACGHQRKKEKTTYAPHTVHSVFVGSTGMSTFLVGHCLHDASRIVALHSCSITIDGSLVAPIVLSVDECGEMVLFDVNRDTAVRCVAVRRGGCDMVNAPRDGSSTSSTMSREEESLSPDLHGVLFPFIATGGRLVQCSLLCTGPCQDYCSRCADSCTSELSRLAVIVSLTTSCDSPNGQTLSHTTLLVTLMVSFRGLLSSCECHSVDILCAEAHSSDGGAVPDAVALKVSSLVSPSAMVCPLRVLCSADAEEDNVPLASLHLATCLSKRSPLLKLWVSQSCSGLSFETLDFGSALTEMRSLEGRGNYADDCFVFLCFVGYRMYEGDALNQPMVAAEFLGLTNGGTLITFGRMIDTSHHRQANTAPDAESVGRRVDRFPREDSLPTLSNDERVALEQWLDGIPSTPITTDGEPTTATPTMTIVEQAPEQGTTCSRVGLQLQVFRILFQEPRPWQRLPAQVLIDRVAGYCMLVYRDEESVVAISLDGNESYSKPTAQECARPKDDALHWRKLKASGAKGSVMSLLTSVMHNVEVPALPSRTADTSNASLSITRSLASLFFSVSSGVVADAQPTNGNTSIQTHALDESYPHHIGASRATADDACCSQSQGSQPREPSAAASAAESISGFQESKKSSRSDRSTSRKRTRRAIVIIDRGGSCPSETASPTTRLPPSFSPSPEPYRYRDLMTPADAVVSIGGRLGQELQENDVVDDEALALLATLEKVEAELGNCSELAEPEGRNAIKYNEADERLILFMAEADALEALTVQIRERELRRVSEEQQQQVACDGGATSSPGGYEQLRKSEHRFCEVSFEFADAEREAHAVYIHSAKFFAERRRRLHSALSSDPRSSLIKHTNGEGRTRLQQQRWLQSFLDDVKASKNDNGFTDVLPPLWLQERQDYDRCLFELRDLELLQQQRLEAIVDDEEVVVYENERMDPRSTSRAWQRHPLCPFQSPDGQTVDLEALNRQGHYRTAQSVWFWKDAERSAGFPEGLAPESFWQLSPWRYAVRWPAREPGDAAHWSLSAEDDSARVRRRELRRTRVDASLRSQKDALREQQLSERRNLMNELGFVISADS